MVPSDAIFSVISYLWLDPHNILKYDCSIPLSDVRLCPRCDKRNYDLFTLFTCCSKNKIRTDRLARHGTVAVQVGRYNVYVFSQIYSEDYYFLVVVGITQ